MTYTREELSQLKHKELQKLCKQTGTVKANKKTFELVNDLAEYFEKEENEMKEMEADMKMYDDLDLNVTWTVENKSENESLDKQDNECNNELLKETLMREVESRAEEKLSRIPRFVADKVTIPPVDITQKTPEVVKNEKIRHHGLKMDSIDVYLSKKQKRAEAQLNFKNEKDKENKRMKMSNSASSLSFRLSESKRKSVRIDDKSIKAPQVKSTPIASKRISLINSTRRSVVKPAPKDDNEGANGRRFTLGCITPTSSTKLDKTPAKFDLKASLNKPLGYKPHTGKLKQVYFNTESNTGILRKPVANVKTVSKKASVTEISRSMKTASRKTSVKEINKNISTREKRRQDAADKRSKNRIVVLDKRRGIVS